MWFDGDDGKWRPRGNQTVCRETVYKTLHIFESLKNCGCLDIPLIARAAHYDATGDCSAESIFAM